MKSLITVFLLICFFNLTFSQQSKVGSWFIYFGNQKINEKLNWHNEIQYRNYNIINDRNQLLLRTGIGLNLTQNNNNILLGFAFIESQNYTPNTNEKLYSKENRIFQQFITKQNFGRIFLQHRYRIEQRFINDDFKIRFRYFLGLNVPLNNKLMAENTIYLSVSNEIFINKELPMYDRNRLYGAIGYLINKYLKVEAGFMNQTLEKSNRNQFQLVIFNNLPF